VEIKNLNSFRNVERAIAYERERQIDTLDRMEKIAQETRLWDADRGVTESMRGKEEAHDYRYFPEPDLVPLRIHPAWIEQIRGTLPELPKARMERFEREYGIPRYDAKVLTGTRSLADYYEAVARLGVPPKAASNWIKDELLALHKGDIKGCPVTPARLAGLLALIEGGTISGKIAKQVLPEMLARGCAAREIVEAQGLLQVSDASAIAAVVDETLAAYPDEARRYREGKTKLFGFFVGEIMKRTQGKANPALVNTLLKERL
jgi:aspartyl-tRNA(Asn)/glutamyl-tRNA(Gln) amidotransferase subunit B